MTSRNFATLDDRSATVPIPEWARQMAVGLARSEAPRARRICRNLLAASTVKEYLQTLGYATDLTQSQCWSPVARQILDVADVGLPGKGILECRPIAPGEATCPVPAEAQDDDRIGYAVVCIDLADTRAATILGFARSVNGNSLSVFDLESMAALPDYLASVRATYQLARWFEEVFETGWAALEDLVAPQWAAVLSPIAAARSGRAAGAESPKRRVRAIDLGAGQAVALVVTLRPESDRTIAVTLEACPCRDLPMPAGLRLVLLDAAGTSVMETQASEAGAGLHFSVEPGERFALELRLENAIAIEYFAA